MDMYIYPPPKKKIQIHGEGELLYFTTCDLLIETLDKNTWQAQAYYTKIPTSMYSKESCPLLDPLHLLVFLLDSSYSQTDRYYF